MKKINLMTENLKLKVRNKYLEHEYKSGCKERRKLVEEIRDLKKRLEKSEKQFNNIVERCYMAKANRLIKDEADFETEMAIISTEALNGFKATKGEIFDYDMVWGKRK